MRMYDIIKKKRDGHQLTKAEIEFAINGFTDGTIPDYQMSALAMAVYFSGMTSEETAILTNSMMLSGDIVDLSEFGDKTVDKHSTGGVGDKTSLIVAPIVASLGAVIAKMSGRGLGHTGGTVDKLEAFAGYNTSLSHNEFLQQVRKVGIALVGQSGNLTPADKKLYALRDVTATVDSMPLIASSIMSKKLAAGAHSIVLDVKMGSGAFLKTEKQARELAREMVSLGKSLGRNVCALITNMDIPLGNNVGNALEIKEAIDVLNGGGPEDLKTVSFALASSMVQLSLKLNEKTALEMVHQAVDSGRALDKLCEWIEAQGSDKKYVQNPDLLCKAPITVSVKSNKDGYISKMDAEQIGICACMLGAGRTVKDGKIDLSAGIVMTKKTGERVCAGDTVAIFHTSKNDVSDVVKKYLSSLEITDKKPEKQPLVYGVV